ncbi:hypothetical protein [uncultured Maricaulis sp.]|uniref:hypothetical protein n=1 Tax=uncultured Maricaulis sp. TaxID=174710 RepID=UPI0030D8813F
MKYFRIGLGILVAAFLVFMGAQKFGAANPVFAYIAATSGIELFEPVIRLMVGVGELTAAALILLATFTGRLRGVGALLAAGVTGGALGFHLSPWLGINAPVAFAPGGGYEFSPMLFMMAVPFFVLSLVLVWLDRDALRKLLGR